jgi:hypothetical protein
LLRGPAELERLWTEEANEVGARVPAVIDEEMTSDRKPLNRVEYFEDIARPNVLSACREQRLRTRLRGVVGGVPAQGERWVSR